MPGLSRVIGYYVHHHGLGHLTRARCIAAALDEPVTVLSSLPAPQNLEPFAGWVTLERDDADDGTDHEAGGALHWSPLIAAGYQERMATIARWASAQSPSVVVVDVSVEVAALVRLLGIPVVVMAGPGERCDAAHQLGYRLASRVIAPWPQDIYDPVHLRPYAEKTSYVGAISRFDARRKAVVPHHKRVLVLFGAGGSDIAERHLTAARKATPGWCWKGFGGGDLTWTDDVWENLLAADVVVTHAGQNVVAEVAASGRPAVLLPQARPFNEQVTTAAALNAAGIAIGVNGWPEASSWPGLLAAAQTVGGRGWSRWSTGDGARRSAAVIGELASHA